MKALAKFDGEMGDLGGFLKADWLIFLRGRSKAYSFPPLSLKPRYSEHSTISAYFNRATLERRTYSPMELTVF